jgi:hypothetical protein
MKRCYIFILLLIFLSTVFAINVDSLDNSVLVSEVNIYSPEFSVSEGVLDLEFEIYNSGYAQASVKYGFEIVTLSGIVVDTYVVDEIVYLGKGDTVTKKINYSLPKYLDGQYSVWVRVINLKGTSLAVQKSSDFFVEASESIVEILPDTCEVVIEGDITGRFLSEGLTVLPEENLLVYCDLVNNTNSPIFVYPVFESYYRNVWSDFLGTKKNEDELNGFDVGEQRKVILSVPIEKEPQAYDALLYFESNGKRVSNEVIIHYVISGQSGTIQIITLNKTKYLAGEDGFAQLYWTPSADAYPYSRNMSSIESGKLLLSINSSGQNCVDDIVIDNISTESEYNIKIPFEVKIDCVDPVVNVYFTNEVGKELDFVSESFISVSDVIDDEDEIVIEPESQDNTLVWVVLIILILIIIVGVVAFSLKKNNGKIFGVKIK